VWQAARGCSTDREPEARILTVGPVRIEGTSDWLQTIECHCGLVVRHRTTEIYFTQWTVRLRSAATDKQLLWSAILLVGVGARGESRYEPDGLQISPTLGSRLF
jgi:hypothetical protein